ncbi:ABC transporter substrate-binding protein [Nocardia sp. NPDC058058]|uniref:ABC transporter substrate-binding protein n=1 Tax=Nocardia sp. NPDC058058 TaxID=3346317 RepID=UPI0036DBA19D
MLSRLREFGSALVIFGGIVLQAAVAILVLSLLARSCHDPYDCFDLTDGIGSRGPITFVAREGDSRTWVKIIDKWNRAHPHENVTLTTQSGDSDQQRLDIAEHLWNFKWDSGYDVVTFDTVWTTEFAAHEWLQPLSGKLTLDTSKIPAPIVRGATYSHTLNAVPLTTDAGMLYYRKDLVPVPPTTWDEMMAYCQIAVQNKIGCYAGQFDNDEDLTVNAVEAISTFGGRILDESGKAAVNTPQAEIGLGKLVEAFRNGSIPSEAISYRAEQSRQAFEAGQLLFLRNWSEAYHLVATEGTSLVKDKFAVAPLPGPSGSGVSTLGGRSAGINVTTKHKSTAIDFLKFLTDAEQQATLLVETSSAPVVADLYTDAALIAKFPYLPTLAVSLRSAVARPLTPSYPAASKALRNNTYAALKGEKNVARTVADLQTALEGADMEPVGGCPHYIGGK